ncbi:MAG: RDD family protein [Woeseiaceae bacterium]
MIETPEYRAYGLLELYQVLNSIRGDLYPQVLAALEQEITRREPTSVVELEDCYYYLDKEKHPDHARRLQFEIESLGGFSVGKPFEITEENKYQTFWPRFWAQLLDSFVVGSAIGLVLLVIHGTDVLRPAARAYVDQVGQIVGIAYFVFMHAKYGQTVGKMAAGVKVWDKSEAREITLRQAILRDIVPAAFAIVSLIYFLGFGVSDDSGELTRTAEIILLSTGIIALAWWLVELSTMLFNQKRRAFHDLIAGTVVTRVT